MPEYRERLIANHWRTWSQASYAFATFPNGRPIEDGMRRWLRRVIDAGRIDPAQPLQVDAQFFDQLDEEAAARGADVTRFMYQVWLDRVDLRQAFDIFTPDGYAGYVNWFLSGDARNYGLDESSIAAARRLTSREASGAPEIVPRRAPPWPAMGTQVWRGAARDADAFLQGDIEITLAGERLLVPINMALIWELRSDLQRHFRLRSIDSLHRFMAWAMTSGVTEGDFDPHTLTSACRDQLAQLTAIPGHDADVPITRGLIITRSVETPASKRYEYCRRFPIDRIGRLAHGFWYT